MGHHCLRQLQETLRLLKRCPAGCGSNCRGGARVLVSAMHNHSRGLRAIWGVAGLTSGSWLHLEGASKRQAEVVEWTLILFPDVPASHTRGRKCPAPFLVSAALQMGHNATMQCVHLHIVASGKGEMALCGLMFAHPTPPAHARVVPLAASLLRQLGKGRLGQAAHQLATEPCDPAAGAARQGSARIPVSGACQLHIVRC